MKISSFAFATILLGLAQSLGPFTSLPFPRDVAGRSCSLPGEGPAFWVPLAPMQDEEPGELERLRAEEKQVQGRIREAERLLGEIESRENEVRRGLKSLDRSSCRLAIGSPGKTPADLRFHLAALEEEKLRFTDLMEQLRSRETALRIQIDLYCVRAERASLEGFLRGGSKSPLESLGRDGADRIVGCLEKSGISY